MLLILVSISQVFCFQEIQLNKTDTETHNLTFEQQICQLGFIQITNLRIKINNIKNKTFCPPNRKQFGKYSSSPTSEKPKVDLQSFPAVIESSPPASLVSQVIITLKHILTLHITESILKVLGTAISGKFKEITGQREKGHGGK